MIGRSLHWIGLDFSCIYVLPFFGYPEPLIPFERIFSSQRCWKTLQVIEKSTSTLSPVIVVSFSSYTRESMCEYHSYVFVSFSAVSQSALRHALSSDHVIDSIRLISLNFVFNIRQRRTYM